MTHQRLCLATALAIGLGLSGGHAAAQTTDGYHSIQVFPLVVDTASFAQRFNFRNPNPGSITITPRFFPEKSTKQFPLGSKLCPNFSIDSGKTAVFASLRDMCPGLLPDSQFGFVHLTAVSAGGSFSGFSRVANPQGQGFTVESFAANEFTSSDSVVNGLRRRASTASTPAYQTNCFMGNLNDLSAGGPRTATRVHYSLYSSSGNLIGSGFEDLLPGQMIRYLDIFSKAGAPDTDHEDAQIRFEEFATDEPAIMSFCTVQDNTSVGADFRIGKQEVSAGGVANPGDVVGPQDNISARETRVDTDGSGRVFQIAASASSSNTHVIYFRHPDYVSCELTDGNGVRVAAGFGLEMRLLDQDGVQVAGTSGTGWSNVYLGDKTDRNDGANGRYTIEVEDAETNSAALRSYNLHCQSGSGHTLGDIIRYQESVDRF